jgi:hypothetical protein
MTPLLWLSLFAAQAAGGAAPALPAGQVFLFEVSRTNFAWGYRHEGLYVDRDGRVFRFARPRQGQPWAPAADETYTEAELRARFGADPHPAGRIAPAELAAMAGLIGAAARGALGTPRQAGADQGELYFGCYTYDEGTGRYRRVLLRREGDWVQANTAPEAVELVNRLRALWAAPAPPKAPPAQP